jgi:Holliday junction resolvase RusA-like endonuclease
MTLVLLGRVPSKKNSKRIGVAGGRPRIFSSDDYLSWEEEQLYRLRNVKARVRSPFKMFVEFYAPNRIPGDCSNKFESIADLLVKAGIIPDDNWFHMVEQGSRLAGIDKENPRAEVEITTLEHPT